MKHFVMFEATKGSDFRVSFWPLQDTAKMRKDILALAENWVKNVEEQGFRVVIYNEKGSFICLV